MLVIEDRALVQRPEAARAMALRFVLERVEPEILERVPLREAARAHASPERGKVLLTA